MLEDYGSIANDLLEAAGYSIYGEKLEDVSPSLGCAFHGFCLNYYKEDVSSGGCDKNNCKLLTDLKTGNVSPQVREELTKKLNISKSSITEDGITLTCPRSLQAKATIYENCTNKKCQFFSKKMAFSCLLLHAKTFFPDEEIPRRVVEVATGLSSRTLDRYNKISIYLARVYLILLKYSLENLKVDYSLTFQTNYIHELLKSGNSGNIIECCPKCGAYVARTYTVKQKVKNYMHDYYTKDYKCDCVNSSLLEERQRHSQEWKDLLEKSSNLPSINNNIEKLSYRKFHTQYKSLLFSRELVLYLISRVNINNLHLADVPLGFILKSYAEMFGEFDPGNLGMNTKIGQYFYELFVERKVN